MALTHVSGTEVGGARLYWSVESAMGCSEPRGFVMSCCAVEGRSAKGLADLCKVK